jgi:nucleotide-binding universal stress UspA family protein
MLLGSVAEKLFRLAHCPVMTIGPRLAAVSPPKSGPRRILYCTGFSLQSLAASAYAFSIAQEHKANLAMLNVVTGVPDAPGSIRDQLESEGKRKLRELIPPDLQLPAEPELMVRLGNAADVILAVADEWRPDLIVLGVRRHETEARRIYWATAHNIVINAPCPVLTIRTQTLG